jgi:predicted alpha/beta superfamily hydrolase
MQPRQTLSPIPDEQMPMQGVAGSSAGGLVMMAALYTGGPSFRHTAGSDPAAGHTHSTGRLA